MSDVCCPTVFNGEIALVLSGSQLEALYTTKQLKKIETYQKKTYQDRIFKIE